MSVQSQIKKLESRIKRIQQEIVKIQDECPHKNVYMTPGSTMKTWHNCVCATCKKTWKT